MARGRVPYKTAEEKLVTARARGRRYYEAHKRTRYKMGTATYMRQYWEKNPEKMMYCAAKSRAKKNNIEFTITEEDITIPEVCPLLGIKLQKGYKKIADTAPSLDRIDISKGYIPGNIQVISYKANRYKSDMSIDLIKKLYDYVLRT